MIRERWPQIREVFEAALEHQPEERTRFLDRVCGLDSALRREVESLLASHKEAGDFIESPPHQLAEDFLRGASRWSRAPRHQTRKCDAAARWLCEGVGFRSG